MTDLISAAQCELVPTNSAYALNYVHILEVENRYQEASFGSHC